MHRGVDEGAEAQPTFREPFHFLDVPRPGTLISVSINATVEELDVDEVGSRLVGDHPRVAGQVLVVFHATYRRSNGQPSQVGGFLDG